MAFKAIPAPQPKKKATACAPKPPKKKVAKPAPR